MKKYSRFVHSYSFDYTQRQVFKSIIDILCYQMNMDGSLKLDIKILNTFNQKKLNK